MEIAQARKIGGRITIRTFIIVILLLEAILFFKETSGDFANGILFFRDAHSNFYLIFLMILSLVVWWLGRMVGKAILIDHQNYLVTGALYGAISIAVALAWMAAYMMAIVFMLLPTMRQPVLMPIAIKFTAGPFITIVLLVVWLLSVLQIKRRRIIPNS